ncbi:MAG: hypothetical protein LKH93_06855 [Clostridium beijerinckii]|jgi:hypothetical protein|uniref:Phage DNA packaging protein Nu1 n=1 Tax=Clostridium beijerinckii TaxID=1520 RepID=A0AAX0B418_CLOBE|nr:hypothetical protein [Clostridium beijerinckii]MCI1478108.1 hypothetical protein [Clostridium beijerinckii]MCI1578591.1 hypothetical protein [Clostridium beijerinckii]MCI1582077.1 hypothetical protein [Clostridium beijerinckii]MCI1621927.1 hypothetical protein [Clostridium beijerinckii]NRT90105.1 hypothetical protein [Clostridium beijerinckii]
MEKDYKFIDDKLCITTSEICSRLDISRKTLAEWSDKGCPKAARGWWPVWEVLAWRGILTTEENISESNMKGTDEYSLNLKKLKYETEYKKQKAEEASFENAIARGEYINKHEIIIEVKRFLTVLKRSMLGYSRKVANEVSPYVESDVARRIEKMITELSMDALEQLSINGVYKSKQK